MKTLKIISALIISSLIGINGTAQDKIGVFIHGFQGSPEKWTEVSEVPQEWTTGDTPVLDEFVALRYETEELLTEQARQKLLDDFISEMLGKEISPGVYERKLSDNWVIISHSLGGLVARDLYPKLKGAGFNIVAVVSVGGPSQGTRATNPDRNYIENRLTLMEERIDAALDKKISVLNFAVNFLDVINGTDLNSKVKALPTYIAEARDSAMGYTSVIVEKDVNKQIGIDGEVIRRINSYPKNNVALHPPNYLSVIGAEKDKTPIRMAGQIFGGDPILKDEVEMVGQLRKLRVSYFQLHEDLYHISFNFHYGANITCRAGLRWFDLWNKCKPHEDRFKKERRNRELWKTAKKELDQIDNIWATIINSKRLETATYREYIAPCQAFDNSDVLGPRVFDNFVDEPECSHEPNGEYVYTQFNFLVPDKNDGVVNTHSVLWSKGDALESTHNQYNSDVPHDGGYNHFELRNYARAYDLPANGSEPGFSKGDENPAMRRAKEWLIDKFGGVSN